MTGRWWIIGALVILVVASAVGVVYSQYEVRVLFAKKQALIAQRDALNVEWGRLQLEQSTWGTQSRVEHVARQKLQMVTPAPDSVEFVKP
jgi:cell division protein FtsL